MSRILVVDDKEMMRDSVARTLTRQGHTVITAPGGRSALEKIARSLSKKIYSKTMERF